MLIIYPLSKCQTRNCVNQKCHLIQLGSSRQTFVHRINIAVSAIHHHTARLVDVDLPLSVEHGERSASNKRQLWARQPTQIAGIDPAKESRKPTRRCRGNARATATSTTNNIVINNLTIKKGKSCKHTHRGPSCRIGEGSER